MRLSGAGESSPAASSPTTSQAASASVIDGPARPIRLVYADEKGKFHMDPEAVTMLQLVKEPVGVVSVCGRARQGKSFILNQLLGRSSGFQVASTHRPCTKGIWMWSMPLQRTALDGTVYNLLLLDSEGIDAYDQSGTYSTQIFSLAVLLSSMFIYNQMGGIDETALDHLSLVTEMTKHIRVRSSGGRSTATELGQFSPVFVWLLRDFYLDLTEDNRKITPRDYLEIALSPVQGGGKDLAAKNKIRESIRELFPDRECFTLLDRLRPEFVSDLDSLSRFVFERTRPKKMGSIVMNGPIFARITQSFLDAINRGAVPTVTSSWQTVEEAECQRAYELGAEVYMSTFDRSKPSEEAALREVHEHAFQKSMDTFNTTAVGAGVTRQMHEKRLQSFLNRAFEDIKKGVYREAYLQCSSMIENMENDLRKACHAPDAKLNTVIKVFDGLMSKYEATCHGPEKWQKAIVFVQQSLEGPLLHFIKKQIDLVDSEKSTFYLKCQSMEDKMALVNKQLEASENFKSDYLKRYENAISDRKRLSDGYTSHITNLQKKYSSLEEKSSNLSKTLETERQESMDWKRKSELFLTKQKAVEEQSIAEVVLLRSKTSAAEARLAANQEKARSAEEEAQEWKRKYEIAVREAKSVLEKAAGIQERANIQTHSRDAALRSELSDALAEKDNEMKEKAEKIEQAEQQLTTLNMELKAVDSKIKNYDQDISSLKFEINELCEKVKRSQDAALSAESKARNLEQEKIHLEQQYKSQFSRFEELQERCRAAEKEAKTAIELADEARAESTTAQKEQSDLQRVAMERQAQVERAKRRTEALKRQKDELASEVERRKAGEKDAFLRVELLEERLRDMEKETDSLLQSNNYHRKNNVQVLESLLETERSAYAKASKRAEALSVQLQVTQGKLDELSLELTALQHSEKSTMDGKNRNASHLKRTRADEFEVGINSVHDTGTSGKVFRKDKRAKSNIFSNPDDGGSVFRSGVQSNSLRTSAEDYTKFTMQKLKQELSSRNFGEQLSRLRNPNKKDILALYEKCVLNKS
ncbi:uncharacterized protein LOC127247299 isoform X2 [Andrographis paniculata]|uniref:uncharacterized protein LOC127247299 isoform X2 n=1 Tax=Andrographis paniculata TaxID=175694 RepID=UPI0021E87418|nr:uncharacterized protein LOC127247299 isoform X2 [Andrographis paniculata]